MSNKEQVIEHVVQFLDALDTFVTTDPRTNEMFADAVRAMPEGYGLIHAPAGWRYCRIEDIGRRDGTYWETVEYVMLELGKEQTSEEREG